MKSPRLLKKLAHVLSTLSGLFLYRSSSSSRYVLEVPSRKLRAKKRFFLLHESLGACAHLQTLLTG